MPRSKMPASRDPSIPHEGRTFYAGRWRTEEEIERIKETKRRSDRTSRHRDRTRPWPGRQWYAGRWRTPEEVEHVRERQRIKNRARYVPRERKTRLSDEERARRAAAKRLAGIESRRARETARALSRARAAEEKRQAPSRVRDAWRAASPGSIIRRKYPTMDALNAGARRGEFDEYR